MEGYKEQHEESCFWEAQARVHYATNVDSQARPSLTALQMSTAVQLVT